MTLPLRCGRMFGDQSAKMSPSFRIKQISKADTEYRRRVSEAITPAGTLSASGTNNAAIRDG